MTDTIIRAFINNKEKFENITKLVTKIEELLNKKENNLNEIKKIYSLVFRNFSPSRITTNVKIRVSGFNDTLQDDNEYNFEEVVLNKDGIFSQRKNASTSSNIIYNGSNFFRILKQIQAKQDEILPCISKVEKKNIFNNFLKDIQLIEEHNMIELTINDKKITRAILFNSKGDRFDASSTISATLIAVSDIIKFVALSECIILDE